MPILRLLVGLPASGKTTFAKQVCEKDSLFVRINYDDLRAMLSQKYSSTLEYKIVQPIAFDVAKKALQLGYNVIVDNTNLNPKKLNEWIELGEGLNAKIEIFDFFDVSLEECLRRNKNRVNPVREDVIINMYNKLNK